MKTLLMFVLFFFFTISFANEVIPGLIPRYYSIVAASDLELSPEIAHQKALDGEDISLIEAKEGSNLYSKNSSTINKSNLIHSDQVTFRSLLKSRLGHLRFTIQDDRGETYNAYLSKKGHNFLLRKNLLEKLGYSVPNIQWKRNLRLDFSSSIDQTLFIAEMKDELLADSERWIVKESGRTLELQDVLIMPANNDIYNLALGLMPSGLLQGRRILRAAYVPLALVDTPESVNLFSWQAGRVLLNQLKLNHTTDLKNTFQTSFEDAKWIARKLATLTREDFVEIVENAHYPESVSLLLTEKIIHRRNDLLKKLKIDNEFTQLSYDADITFGKDLIKGELNKEFFDGFASRFSFGDPESPFSNSELGSYALSRLQSEVFTVALNKFNKMLGNDFEKAYINKLKDIVSRKGQFFPTQALVVPSVSGGLILSRNIVPGTYLGTNNRVQLVDNLGVNFNAGAIMGIEGLPTPLSFKAGSGINFQRLYSHVRPITSLKKAIRDPYKNLVVPMLLKSIAKKMNDIKNINSDNQELVIASIIGDLKKSLAVGESFIMTDSITPNINAELGVSLSAYAFLDDKLLKMYAAFQARKMKIARLHIHRKDENTLHFYQDDGSSLKMAFSVRLKSYIPILGIQARWQKAKALTKYFKVSLKGRDVDVSLIKALRNTFLTLNTKVLSQVIKPFVIKHAIGEYASTLNFLFFKRNRIKTNHSIDVRHNHNGEEIRLLRRYDATSKGKDFENFFVESLNNVFSQLLELDFNISQSAVINPGFTIGGKANNKIYISETDGTKLHTEYKRIINGWRSSGSKLSKKLKKLNRDFGKDLFNPLEYKNTNSIMLYQLQVFFKLDDRGIRRILNLKDGQILWLLQHYKYGHDEQDQVDYALSMKSRFTKINKLFKYDKKEALKKWHKALDSLIDAVTIQGLIKAAGKDSIVSYGRIDGFRTGDEAGDSPVISDVYGELPGPLHLSITQDIQRKIGITEGELLASWLTEVAI